MLLGTNQLRVELEESLEKSERFLCYSAFFTKPAAEWLLKHREFTINDCLLVRALPEDFISGSCSFDALKLMLRQNINVRMSTALHAKIYAFDDCVYAGSANLTARGLALVDQHNQEIGLKGSISSNDLELLENLWSQAETITDTKLKMMEEFCHQHKIKKSLPDMSLIWPKEILNEVRDIYCSDFPQDYPTAEIRFQTETSLQGSLAYNWLKNAIIDNGSMSFGALSALLHDDIYDDPSPYRRDIKTLLANLLSIVITLDTHTLEIIRPRHSQVVKLR
tara:strand:- start:1344 stop:2180 length:837 start_codon:yes stop_codon:yes gene_type:complete